MSNFNNDLIQKGWIRFATDLPENIPVSHPLLVSSDTPPTYGALSFNVTNMEMNTCPQLFDFMVDVSGSMSDKTRDGRTKMQLIIHTLTNMVHYFAENAANVYIRVVGFDDAIHRYIELTNVTPENVNELIEKISKMHPQNLTNIELALNTVADHVRETVDTLPHNRRMIVLLTDGDTTAGENNPQSLAALIPSGVSANFIALGDNHNESIMYALGHRNPLTSNWFVSELEHAGNVYGEIVYNETHPVLDNAIIRMTDGQIFDYITGKFVDELALGMLSSESKKQYHIITSNPDTCVATIFATNSRDGSHIEVEISDMPPLVTCLSECVDEPHFVLSQYLRLGVQSLMSESRIAFKHFGSIQSHPLTPKLHPKRALDDIYAENIIDDGHVEDERNAQRKNLRKRSSALRKYILDFIEQHNLNDDALLNGLCDDLNVLIKTIENPNGAVKFSAAREDSQGRQTTYNTVSDMQIDPTTPIRPPLLQRAPTSAYSTPGRLNVMRALSNSDQDSVPDEYIPDSPSLLPPSLVRQSARILSLAFPEEDDVLNTIESYSSA